MSSIAVETATKLTSLTPQFLVDDLPAAINYYRDCLGFETDFVYGSFYASVGRDGFSIHLKCAPKTVADRAYRKENEHLDVYIGVQGIESLFNELQTKQARITRALADQPWNCRDFYIEDVDGYILCFSEQIVEA
ncbi:MAG TPA: VOC family protein [Pyrinomonadaceae bacterium]